MTSAKQILDMSNPIVIAVMPQKKAAQDYALKMKAAEIDAAFAELQAAGFDRNIVAPYPKSSAMSVFAYRAAVAKYSFFCSITEATKEYNHSMTAPKIVQMSNEGCDKVKNLAVREAGEQYDAFVCKLTRKIGEVLNAKITGHHVWGESFLTVTKTDNITEVWKTHQIWNTSKYGKSFAQWPSRKQNNKL